MGLISSRLVSLPLFTTCLATFLSAAPQLRLVQTTVGPVSIATGANGPSQTVEAFNAGDGSLALSLSSTAPWLNLSAGAPRPCSLQEGNCIPLQIGLQTASLKKGSYTGVVTVSDPKALDAPQTITVTVQIGGGIPDKIDFYVPTGGGSDSLRFSVNRGVGVSAATQTGGNWLSASLEGTGSFRFTLPYLIVGSQTGNLAEGTYSGSLAVSGSQVQEENKTVPVTLRVTSQPILQAAPQSLSFRIAQGSAPQRVGLALSNRGSGSLTVTSVTVSGASWLTAERVPGYDVFYVTANPAGLSPGAYSASVMVGSNAANAQLTVPVELQVSAAGPPVATFGGTVNNATFAADEPLAQGGLVALFGEQFVTGDPVSATKVPLDTTLGGVRVYVNNVPAPLFYASYGQINFQMPFETPVGRVQIQVERAGTRGNTITTHLDAAVPRILRIGIDDYGIIVNQDGSFPMPRMAGLNSHPAKRGDVLVVYALGLGPTSVSVPSGQGSPAGPLAWVNGTQAVFGFVTFLTGGIPVEPLFAGLTPGFVGLYQINVTIPETLPSGDQVPLRLRVNGTDSDPVIIAVQ